MVKERVMDECLTMSEAYDEGYQYAIEYVKELITERLKMDCNKASCDDCEECCEVTALMYIDSKLDDKNRI